MLGIGHRRCKFEVQVAAFNHRSPNQWSRRAKISPRPRFWFTIGARFPDSQLSRTMVGGWASVKLASTQSSDLVRVRARLDGHSGILLVMVTLSLWWLVGPINTNLMLSNIVNFNEYCKVKVNQRLQLWRQNRNKYYCETCFVYSTTFKLDHLRGEAYFHLLRLNHRQNPAIVAAISNRWGIRKGFRWQILRAPLRRLGRVI